MRLRRGRGRICSHAVSTAVGSATAVYLQILGVGSIGSATTLWAREDLRSGRFDGGRRRDRPTLQILGVGSFGGATTLWAREDPCSGRFYGGRRRDRPTLQILGVGSFGGATTL